MNMQSVIKDHVGPNNLIHEGGIYLFFTQRFNNSISGIEKTNIGGPQVACITFIVRSFYQSDDLSLQIRQALKDVRLVSVAKSIWLS